MKVGIPTEIKEDENRVAITPSGVAAFVSHGRMATSLSFRPAQGPGVPSPTKSTGTRVPPSRLMPVGSGNGPS